MVMYIQSLPIPGREGHPGHRDRVGRGRLPAARLSAAGLPGASPPMSRQPAGVRTDFSRPRAAPFQPD